MIRRASAAALRQGALGLVIPLILLAGWETIGWFRLVRPTLLPPPSAVVATLVDLARRGELWEHVEITLLRVVAGFLIGTAAGTLFGALTGYSRLWRQLLDPLLQGLRSIPSIAWVPLFVLWLGIFEAAKVTLIAIGVFFPVYLNLMAGIQDVDRRLVEVGRVYRFSALTLVRRILVPATLPAYLTGLRGGLGLGWMFVVAAEIMGASQGLGFLLVDGQQTGRPATIIAAIILFAGLGKLTDLALAALGRRALAWQDSFGNSDVHARNSEPVQAL
ncbi:MAG TPA: ABC transporter permease [Stellaceae bacterium]|nr:ABC transporter permease [Stellaceae bacterium]